MTRLMKQLIFGALYLAVFGSLGWGAFRIVVPAPVCTDGIQNGREEGVDCGAVCGRSCPPILQALQVLPSQIIRNSDGSTDVVAQIKNINTAYGASNVEYTLTVKGAEGEIIAVRHGTTYANTIQSQYLVFPLGKTDKRVATTELVIDEGAIKWGILTADASQAVEFAVRNDQTAFLPSSARLEASALNRSRFDFDEVNVAVLLFDASNQVIAAGSTVIRTLKAGETRDFVIDWPFAIAGVVRHQISIGTNVFDNENYIRAYGAHEENQGF